MNSAGFCRRLNRARSRFGRGASARHFGTGGAGGECLGVLGSRSGT